MHREAVTYIDKAPKGVLKYHDFKIHGARVNSRFAPFWDSKNWNFEIYFTIFLNKRC